MIEVKSISKSFNDKLILDDVSVKFLRGKVNLVIGQSGSGKTVLINCIVGLLEPDKGDILYNNVAFNHLELADKKLIRQQIGMLFQGGALFDFATVEENVMFPLEMFTNYSKEEKLHRVNSCLKRVNIINSNKQFPSELSGGMQKRVAIARAIVLNPKYLLCDEPNSGLDPITALVIDNLIKEITYEYNITTIVNTHDMNSVMEIGDKVVFIHDGKIAWEGSNSDILTSNNEYINNFVFASNKFRKENESKD